MPTGNDSKGIGSNNELEIEPFVTFGYKGGRIEFVALVALGIPTNQSEDEKDEVDLELAGNFSLMLHLNEQETIQLLIELNGEMIISGEENEQVLYLTPGFKFRPIPGQALDLGVGFSLPVSQDREAESHLIISAFYHF